MFLLKLASDQGDLFLKISQVLGDRCIFKVAFVLQPQYQQSFLQKGIWKYKESDWSAERPASQAVNV